MYRQASLDLQKFLLLLNRGTQEDISKLPGVGKKTLHQLLDLRTVKANATLKDVISSTCIGVGTLKKITGNEHVVKLVQFCQYFEETFKTIEVYVQGGDMHTHSGHGMVRHDACALNCMSHTLKISSASGTPSNAPN